LQPDPDVELIAKNLEGVKNIVLVLSGKVGWRGQLCSRVE